MLSLLHAHFPVLGGVALALLLILWPPPRRPQVEAQRKARLAELDAGAEERFFEERRSLETYGRGSAAPFRLWGVLLLALSVALLFL